MFPFNFTAIVDRVQCKKCMLILENHHETPEMNLHIPVEILKEEEDKKFSVWVK